MKCQFFLFCFLAILLFSFLVQTSSCSILTFKTTIRFHLSAYDTYIYLGKQVYSDKAYLYSDKVVFSNVYTGSGTALDSLTIEPTNANLTINKVNEENEVACTLSASTGTVSTTRFTFPSKPVIVKVSGVEKVEGDLWIWNEATKQLTVTPTHASDVALSFLWSGTPSSVVPGGPYTPPGDGPITPSVTTPETSTDSVKTPQIKVDVDLKTLEIVAIAVILILFFHKRK